MDAPPIPPSQIQDVRRFNRLVTRRAGALEDSYLARGRPLGAARLLFEIGGAGADLRELRARLGLDSAYLSRLLRTLERQGLVTLETPPGDARRRRALLTPEGLAERAVYDALSDRLAGSMLTPLDERQRARLLAAMGEVERLIRAACVTVALEPADGPDAQACLLAYYRDLDARFEGGFDVAQANPLPEADIRPPRGAFAVARLDGVAVGCGALKRAAPEIGEIKRMWTAPQARGLGIARRLLRLLEATARAGGCTRVRLDTNRALPEAQAFYRAENYRPAAPFNRDPYADFWFEKDL
ncbi:bifunctional helix-turn-helix transcriptional regulator/GNAT family N-acetyltransferase [Aquabacter spiritensis]|uniref:MarR family transcriptional regulator with acetyltransferase activity n=1 Tax=Aquabacter spiritensis TaxID=933073 RepID=A0A4R3LS24_9HYPH|nr:helix-turn-helix domain-containing GNAT family N-acetyltransferase [Aquabacter spiritensis]TCT03312.1 MarR family transcriptional regulator with acetyltransferase activity [Aquabacter spiritensis]